MQCSFEKPLTYDSDCLFKDWFTQITEKETTKDIFPLTSSAI